MKIIRPKRRSKRSIKRHPKNRRNARWRIASHSETLTDLVEMTKISLQEKIINFDLFPYKLRIEL